MKQDGADTGGRSVGRWDSGRHARRLAPRHARSASRSRVCMVLLISAGLLMRALHAAQTDSIPISSTAMSRSCRSSLRGQHYDDDATVAAFQRRLLERVAALPGVDDCRAGEQDSVEPRPHQTMFRLPGQDQWHEVNVNTVSPDLLFSDRNPHPPRSDVHGGRARRRVTRRHHHGGDGETVLARATIRSAGRSSWAWGRIAR